MKETFYSIKDLEVLSGVKAHTIRIWEKRYFLFQPKRTSTNIRYYNCDDLRKVLNVSQLVKNGFRISKISGWGEKEMVEKISAINENNTSDSEFVEKLLIYMINFEDDMFHQLVDEIFQQQGFEKAMIGVFFPLFYKIGFYWQVGSIFPAQEHFVSNLIRQKLITEMNRLAGKSTREETVLFFLHEEEKHELGLLFYSVLAMARGYKVLYLGQSVPFIDLKKILQKRQVHSLFTSFVNSIPKDDLQGYLNELSELFQKQRIYVTGGQIQAHKPSLSSKIKIVKNVNDFTKYFGAPVIS